MSLYFTCISVFHAQIPEFLNVNLEEEFIDVTSNKNCQAGR